MKKGLERDRLFQMFAFILWVAGVRIFFFQGQVLSTTVTNFHLLSQLSIIIQLSHLFLYLFSILICLSSYLFLPFHPCLLLCLVICLLLCLVICLFILLLLLFICLLLFNLLILIILITLYFCYQLASIFGHFFIISFCCRIFIPVLVPSLPLSFLLLTVFR